MQISMQMRLAKLKHSDWQAGAVGKETAVPGKHAGQGLSLPAAMCFGKGMLGTRPQHRYLSFKVYTVLVATFLLVESGLC